jgi:AcrR family transcriptional regulator
VARKYELKARAERQAQTRLRIVEAAIELHRTKGPAHTTISDIARLAGVERHTIYRHFPDERAIGLACSGLYTERNPPPDAAPWLAIAEPDDRRRVALTELYRWYARNEDMFGSVMRDAEVDPDTREMFNLRAGKEMGEIRDVLAEGLPDSPPAQAALALVLDFHAWRRLARSGLSPEQAAELMVCLLRCR